MNRLAQIHAEKMRLARTLRGEALEQALRDLRRRVRDENRQRAETRRPKMQNNAALVAEVRKAEREFIAQAKRETLIKYWACVQVKRWGLGAQDEYLRLDSMRWIVARLNGQAGVAPW